MANRTVKPKGFAVGEAGKSLFYRPYSCPWQKNELPELFQKVVELDDHRLLAIVTALIVELQIDDLLRAFIPKFDNLLENSDFTFAMKVSLLESMTLIPPRITGAAHCLRKIRNEFAHDLRIVLFDQLPQKLKAALATHFDDFAQDAAVEHDCAKGKSLMQLFKALSFYCISSLNGYKTNISMLRGFINHPDFEKAIAQFVSGLVTSYFSELERGVNPNDPWLHQKFVDASNCFSPNWFQRTQH